MENPLEMQRAAAIDRNRVASFERWLEVVVASLEGAHLVPRRDVDQLVQRHLDSLRALHQGRIAPVSPIKWLYYEWRAEFASSNGVPR